MKTHEISIFIDDKNYVDSLIISLVRMGYEAYLSYDKDAVCFTTCGDEVKEITKGNKQSE